MNLLLLLALLSPASAEMKTDKLLAHIRETYALPSDLPLAATAPRPSGLPGLEKVVVTFGEDTAAKEQVFYLSANGKNYFMADIQDIESDPDAERRAKLTSDGAAAKGAAKAPVTIFEFSDFECPFCRKAHEGLKEGLQKYKGKVRLVFKHFPLENIHPWAKTAALATACAQRQKEEAAWTFIDGLFEKQTELKPDTVPAEIEALAKKAGLDTAKFKECIEKGETAAQVQGDQKEGFSAGVTSTPFFFVNGHPIRGFADFKPFAELIDEMLKGKHPAGP